MPVYSSPGVYVLEKDISDIVVPLATASAALVGYSVKGNVDDIVLITSAQQFIDEYGEPDPTSGHYFHYAALAYLEQGSQLYCLRVVNGALYGGANIMVTTSAQTNAGLVAGQSTKTFTVQSGMSDDILFEILGANPGVWNNRISVVISNVQTGSAEEVTDQYTFVIDVYWQDDDGNSAKVESFTVSRKHKLSGEGKQLYLEDVINGVSDYICVADNTAIADTGLPKAQATALSFLTGSNGSAISASQVVTGWNSFADPETVQLRILINGGETDQSVQIKMKAVAEARQDCIAILDVPYASINSVSDITTWRSSTQNFNSSYCAVYAPWVQIRDSYNDLLIDVPPSGYAAGAYARNDNIGNVWDAPAGEERGVLNVIDVYPLIFNKGDRDTLYTVQINPIQKFQGRGIFIYGQKTEQRKNSALNRVNVRRLLITIEQDVSEALKPFILGPNANNTTTRFRVTALLDQYMDLLSARGAFQTEGGDKGFHVVCSEENNTPAVIDLHELHVDIFVKPVRTVEFIQLRAIITTTAASFQELVAKGIIF